MIKKIKWWFEVRKDLKLLKKLDKKLNGHIYQCSDSTDTIEFHGEKYWCKWHEKRLKKLVQKKDKILETYSITIYEKRLEEAREMLERSAKKCQALNDKITALKFKIYGNYIDG